MSKFTNKFSLILTVALFAFGFVGGANAQTRRTSETRVRDLVRQIRVSSDNFRTDFDASLRNVRLRGTEADNINRDIEDFERAVSDFDDRFNDRQASATDVESILTTATNINRFLRTARLGTRVDRDWSSLKLSLNSLAREYNINNWNYDGTGSTYPSGSGSNQNYPDRNYPAGNSNNNGRLNGTFRLDATRSDNARTVADRAVQNLPTVDRDNNRDLLEQRLETPDQLAIQQTGQQVTIASTRAAQYTFTADGRDKYETAGNGTQVRVRATLNYSRLEVATSGDRGNDYNVAFESIENGRTLRVERRITTDALRQPVVLQSFYTKTSDIAQLDIYENPNGVNNTGDNRYPGDNGTGRGGRRGDYVIANNESLRATLDTALSTKTANENDRFTMTVQTPDQYKGAIIEGYLSNVQRSGKVTGRSGMIFNFETIRLRDGKTYAFNGFVESIRNLNGEEIKVGNEGGVQGGSQTKTTATRGAIGAGIGAVIGAIAGGGKGAAIGAILGGGAGAGSVYIEGRDDLEINSGSDVYVRSSSPERRTRN